MSAELDALLGALADPTRGRVYHIRADRLGDVRGWPCRRAIRVA